MFWSKWTEHRDQTKRAQRRRRNQLVSLVQNCNVSLLAKISTHRTRKSLKKNSQVDECADKKSRCLRRTTRKSCTTQNSIRSVWLWTSLMSPLCRTTWNCTKTETTETLEPHPRNCWKGNSNRANSSNADRDRRETRHWTHFSSVRVRQNLRAMSLSSGCPFFEKKKTTTQRSAVSISRPQLLRTTRPSGYYEMCFALKFQPEKNGSKKQIPCRKVVLLRWCHLSDKGIESWRWLYCSELIIFLLTADQVGKSRLKRMHFWGLKQIADPHPRKLAPSFGGLNPRSPLLPLYGSAAQNLLT